LYNGSRSPVRSDAEWQNAQAVLDAVKANPGQHKASGTGQGGIWHLALAGMLQEAGIAPDAAPWVPSQGAAPGLQDLVAGGVDIVTCSVPEAQALPGRPKSLAVSETQPGVPGRADAQGGDG
jgi:tripartite-type tricarboxylate transporter receptor subunit TctC